MCYERLTTLSTSARTHGSQSRGTLVTGSIDQTFLHPSPGACRLLVAAQHRLRATVATPSGRCLSSQKTSRMLALLPNSSAQLPFTAALAACTVMAMLLAWFVLGYRALARQAALRRGTRTILTAVAQARADVIVSGKPAELSIGRIGQQDGLRLASAVNTPAELWVLPRDVRVRFWHSDQTVDSLQFDSQGHASADRIELQAGTVNLSVPVASPVVVQTLKK